MLSIVQLNLSVDPKLVSALNSLEALYVLIAHLSCFEAAKLKILIHCCDRNCSGLLIQLLIFLVPRWI